jgi:hypothetical protein
MRSPGYRADNEMVVVIGRTFASSIYSPARYAQPGEMTKTLLEAASSSDGVGKTLLPAGVSG